MKYTTHLVTIATVLIFGATSITNAQTETSKKKKPAPAKLDDATIRASARHYADRESIPGLGTAIGDVYILPNGGCFGEPGKSGVRMTNGATMYFGASITAQTPMRLVQAGSPATKREEKKPE